MTGFLPLLKKEIKEQLRTHKLLIVGAIFLLFGITTPLMLKYMPQILDLAGAGGMEIELPPPTALESLIEYAGTVGQIGVLVAILMAMGSVANELKQGTAVITLSKPVSRAAFINAKLVAVSLTFTVALVIASIVCFVYTSLLIENGDLMGFIGQNLLMVIFFVFCIAVTLLFSSLFNSSIAAGGIAIAVIIAQAGLSAIPRIGSWFPGKLLSWGNALTAGMEETYWPALIVTIVITAICLYLSQHILNRKNI